MRCTSAGSYWPSAAKAWPRPSRLNATPGCSSPSLACLIPRARRVGRRVGVGSRPRAELPREPERKSRPGRTNSNPAGGVHGTAARQQQQAIQGVQPACTTGRDRCRGNATGHHLFVLSWLPNAPTRPGLARQFASAVLWHGRSVEAASALGPRWRDPLRTDFLRFRGTLSAAVS